MSNYNELRLTYQGGRQETITLSSDTIAYGEYQQLDIVAVEVPEIVQTIGGYAFCDNNSLANIVLNEGLQRIEGQAFQHGVYTAVTIPSTVTYIGMNAFNTREEQGLYQHTFTLTCLASTPPTLVDDEGITFGDPNLLSAIYVPDGSVSAYQQAWSAYASKIQGGIPADDNLTNLNIVSAYVGYDEVVKMYLGSDVVWEPAPEPEPVYSAMPLTFKVLSAGTINFTKMVSTAATADTCAFVPILNGENIGEYNPALGGNGWLTNDTSTHTVNVQAGDVFQLYSIENRMQVLGKGTGRLAYTSYHTFSGSTAVVEVYGNIMSVCSEPATMTGFTSWSGLAEFSFVSNIDFVITSLFRNMPGLVSAENLWFPDDVPAFGYENLFKGSGVITAPKVLPSVTVYDGSYASMFDSCTSLTGSPIIKAETIARKGGLSQPDNQFYRMFYNCSNLNKITCFADQTDLTSTQRTGYFSDWVSGVASTGNFYKRNGTGWYTGTNGFPSGWTMNIYQE